MKNLSSHIGNCDWHRLAKLKGIRRKTTAWNKALSHTTHTLAHIYHTYINTHTICYMSRRIWVHFVWDMMTSWRRNAFCNTGPLWGVTDDQRQFALIRTVMRSFDTRLLQVCWALFNKQSSYPLFETSWCHLTSPSIHIHFRLGCCPCAILWGWQHKVMSNSDFPCISVLRVNNSQTMNTDISLHSF